MPRTEVKYEEPKFNLKINIVYPINWENEGNPALKEEHKNVIMWANGLLKGEKHVTNDGYIRDKHIGDLTIVNATLDLDAKLDDDHNFTGIKGIVGMKPDARIHINYGGRAVDYIGVEKEKGLYIAALKQEFNSGH